MLRLRLTDRPDPDLNQTRILQVPVETPFPDETLLDSSPLDSPLFSSLRVRWLRTAVTSFASTLRDLSIPIGIQSSQGSEIAGTLLNRDLLHDSIPAIPKTFTDFRKWVEKNLPEPSPPAPARFPVSSLASHRPDMERFEHAPLSAIPFEPTEGAALARIEEYFFTTGGLRNYKKTRNGLMGPEYSSKFSIFLASGLVSARTIWAKVREHEARFGVNEGSEWMRFELLWREFFKHQHLHTGDQFFSREGLQERPQSPVRDYELFLRWTRAETGEPFIDANLRELNATGFMSNRGRQNVASHFIHTLRLPWWWGARYFEYSLLDYDPTQNWGNWSYQAGVGADPRSFGGAPRLFDVQKQARDYDPDGAYQRLWGTGPAG